VKVGKDFTLNTSRSRLDSPDFQAKVEEAGNGQFKIDVQTAGHEQSGRVDADDFSPRIHRRCFYATARITNAPTVTVAQRGATAPVVRLCDWSNALKFLFARQGCCNGSLGVSPGRPARHYFRDKISWASGHCAVGNGGRSSRHANGATTAIWVDHGRTMNLRASTFPARFR